MTVDFLTLLRGTTTAAPAHTAGPVRLADGVTAYGLAALEAEADNVRNSVQGSRNHALNVAAFNLAQLVAARHLDEADVINTLTDAARTAGLQPREITATIRSGMRSGRQQPRDVDELPDPTEPHVEEVTLADIINIRRDDTDPTFELPTDDPEPGRAPTSWFGRPATQRAAEQASAAEPTFLARADGHRLLYPGKINGVIGESESGKTWLAIHAVCQALADGHRVLYLDFEDAASTLVERLRRLGVTDEQLDRIHYADPDTSLGALEQEDLAHTLSGFGPELVIVDGANAAMSLLGLDLNSNTDATIFNRRLLKSLAAGGAAVLTIDHVPKNSEQRGKGGIGAQAKRAMIDGCQLVAEVVKPFGLGQCGEVKLTIDKDRSGHVRGIAAGAKYIGKLIIDSTVPNTTTMRIEPPHSDEQGSTAWQPTYLMEQVSKLLEDVPDGLSGRQIRDEVKGRTESVLAAIEALVEGEWVARKARPGRGGGLLYSLSHPYREGDHPKRFPTGSQLAPGTVTDSGSEPVPPLQGTGATSNRSEVQNETLLDRNEFGGVGR